MTAFLVWKGMSMETASLWRGVSSAMGLLGTFVYHVEYHLSLWLSFALLRVFFVEDYHLSMTMLITGACKTPRNSCGSYNGSS